VCTSRAGGFPVKCPEKPFSRNLSARTNCANAAVSRVPAAAAEAAAAAVMNGLPYSGIELYYV